MLVCKTVVNDRVAVGGDAGFGVELFLELEERLEDFQLVMEIVVHDVDEQRIVHEARNKLA